MISLGRKAVICVLAGVFFSTFLHAQPVSDPYAEGLKQIRAGRWQEGLRTWAAGYAMLDSLRVVDPRIGFGFIEVATAREAKALYQLACEMYNWALSSPNPLAYRTSYTQELRRLQPILDPEQFTRWQNMLAAGDTLFLAELREFWRDKDPTPTTPITNERLLEHWERIAYARRHFNKGRNTVYGTDDRGLIYVKYGLPDIQDVGRLGTNRLVFKRWTDVLLQYHRFTRQDAERFIQFIDRYNTFPEYEIWIYRQFDTDEPIFYLFGRRNGTGSFGLRNGVEDFIPDIAFRRTTGRYNLLPGAILQTVYYGELSHFSNYFADRLRELEQAWESFERSGMYSASRSYFRTIRSRFVSLEKSHAKRYPLPDDYSTFDDDLATVNMTIQPIRRLDPQNRPQLAVVVVSSTSFSGERATSEVAADSTPHRLVHSLRIFRKDTADYDELQDHLKNTASGISTFYAAHDSSITEMQTIAEVFSLNPDGAPEAVFSRHPAEPPLTGYNEIRFPIDPPLNPDPDSLELSDLVIGSLRSQDTPEQQLPFPVVPAIDFWQAENLMVYLEIYHLFFDENSRSRFTIELEVARLRGLRKKKKEMISLSHSYERTDRTASEYFGVDISNLPPGEYELTVTVKDAVSGQQKSRDTRFKILTPGEMDRG